MEKIITIIAAIAGIAFWIGLINPKWVFMPNRKKSSLFYFSMCLVVAAIGASLRPSTSNNAQERPPIKEEKFKYADLSLKEWRVKNDKEDRREIVNSYVKFKKIPESARNDFYNCLSEYSHRKSEELHLDQVLDWCYSDFTRDATSLSDRINFDNFDEMLSDYNGVYYPLEVAIKEQMNDDSSYKHIKTTHQLMFEKDKKPYAVFVTTFRGANALGATVKNTVSAKVDIATGKIVELKELQ
ncbi:hypothetical protein MF935_002398 [Escherichia coli]|nr:hypothetical protein [Escherichia coli]